MESEPFFRFCSIDKTGKKVRKNTKANATCLKQNWLAFRLPAYVRQTRSNFHVETCKFERRIAEKQNMIVITCVMYGKRFSAIFLDGWRIVH